VAVAVSIYHMILVLIDIFQLVGPILTEIKRRSLSNSGISLFLALVGKN